MFLSSKALAVVLIVSLFAIATPFVRGGCGEWIKADPESMSARASLVMLGRLDNPSPMGSLSAGGN